VGDCSLMSFISISNLWMTFHEPHEMLPKEKKVKNPLPKRVEWSDGNGNVIMKPRELNEKDREELSFLFNRDYEMSIGEKGGWKV